MNFDNQKSPRSYGYIDMRRKKTDLCNSDADIHTLLPILWKSLKEYEYL